MTPGCRWPELHTTHSEANDNEGQRESSIRTQRAAGHLKASGATATATERNIQ